MLSSTGNSNSFSGFGNQWSSNSSWSDSSNFSQAAYNGSSTFGVISELKFLAAKSSRQSTIILASFNIVSAAATAAGILYNNYLSVKRSPLRRGKRVNIFTCVRGPDVYPFILSLGIVVQGIIFAVSQAQGLDSLFQAGCALISVFMWPAVFIVPYIQLAFAVETTLRALQSNPFPPRSKWTVAICLTIVKIALLATGLVTFFYSCTQFLFRFSLLVRGKMGTGRLCASNKHRHHLGEEDERVGASRMIYYIVLAIIPNTLMIPFFSYLSFGNPFENNGDTGLTLSMVSTVVANVTGLMTGGLYLFLRSSTISSISPKNKFDEYESQQMKFQMRMPSPSDTDFNSHITKPVTAPQRFRRTESPDEGMIGEPQRNIRSYNAEDLNPFRASPVFQQSSVPRSPNDTHIPLLMAPVRKASSSYTLFPNQSQGNRVSKALLPSTTYSPNASETLGNDCCDMLMPPPSIQPPGFRHRRDSSMASSATVQIGLRLSNVQDVRPTTASTDGGVERTHELGCPNRPTTEAINRPSPLITRDSVASSPSSHYHLGLSQADTAMKTLPPVPHDFPVEVDRAPILNPTVYSPNSPTKGKVPSPKGVGFNVPMRTNTTPIEAIGESRPASRLPGNSAAGADRADWI
ncbi:hypothetical protein EKO27_g10951 [Xylaria grammica]|uniref:Uncharacterized protein n=1 Tax=Xylaria grammica TaxID=363999 RepID=A0A439CPS8_9PEZI|nr:hypothetical protein EKO27_g10951 [Xylaria grammica]